MLSFDQVRDMLASSDAESRERLRRAADDARKTCVGDEVHIRGLLEVSNYCRRDCLYCGLRRGNKKVSRYRMCDEEIIDVVARLAESGIKTAVIQSGEDPALNAMRVCRLVERIKSSFDIAVTLSLGEYSREDYVSMRSAGADRYLLRHETSDENLYAALHPDSSLANRLKCLEWIKDAGLQTGAGMMIGLPGQTIDSIAKDILFLRSFGVHMAGIGPFIPDPDTPLGDASAGDFDLAMRTLAVARLTMPHLLIPATTATGVLRHGGRARALQFGANVIMVNATPDNYRELYKIYPNKDRDEPYSEDPFKSARDMILSEGRIVSEGYGHSPIICGTRNE